MACHDERGNEWTKVFPAARALTTAARIAESKLFFRRRSSNILRMSKSVKPIPDGYPVVAPYICVRGAAKALEFYKEAFGAKERMRMEMPGGMVGHAEIQLGDSVIMLADEFPQMNFHGPEKFGGTPVTLHLYVTDVDAVVARAVSLGAKIVRPVQNQFYGDRSGMITDPFGHSWNVATHVEDVSHEETAARAAKMKGDC
jgi:PhnB protein